MTSRSPLLLTDDLRADLSSGGRFLLWLREILVSVDQLLHVVLGGPKYILVGGPLPSADETISSKVGRMALRGNEWAVVCADAIDWVFEKLGDPDHCNRCIEWDEVPVLHLAQERATR